jgi:hypothetical protein
MTSKARLNTAHQPSRSPEAANDTPDQVLGAGFRPDLTEVLELALLELIAAGAIDRDKVVDAVELAAGTIEAETGASLRPRIAVLVNSLAAASGS